MKDKIKEIINSYNFQSDESKDYEQSLKDCTQEVYNYVIEEELNLIGDLLNISKFSSAYANLHAKALELKKLKEQ